MPPAKSPKRDKATSATKARAKTPKPATAKKARSGTAKKPKAPFEDYAFKQGLGMIGEGFPGITIEKSATTATARFGKDVLASMVRDGDDHVVIGVLVQPEDRKFAADPHGTGWFQVRLGPVPKAWFRADLTSLVLGTVGALKAAAEVGKWKSLLSEGGPYVVLPKSAVKRWGEDAEGTDADAATRAGDTAAVIKVAAGSALILGTPDRLYFHKLAGGGMFVRVVSFDADDDRILAKHVKSVTEKVWSSLDVELAVTEPLWAFEATSDGVAIGTGNSLQCDVPRGTYALDTATYKPDAGTELLLVRLRKP